MGYADTEIYTSNHQITFKNFLDLQNLRNKLQCEKNR